MKMHVSRRSRSAFAVALISGLSGLEISYGANTPIALTSGTFNENVIVNTTPVPANTYGGFDTENGISFWGPGYSSSNALPASGSFTSSFNSATQFQLQPYSGNTAMLINADNYHTTGGVSQVSYAPAYGQTGTITFQTPEALTTLALLNSAAIQTGATSFSINYTLNFSDGTPSYNNSGNATFTAYEWNSTTASAIGSLGRVWVQGSNLGNAAGTNWAIHESDITIPAAYVTHPISSISFFDPGQGSYSVQVSGHPANSFSVFAASGSATTILTYTGTDPSTPASWDSTSLNFTNGSSPSAFTTGAVAIFDDTASGSHTVSIPSAVTPLAVVFNNNSSSYSISGSAITGTGSLTLTGLGTVTLNNSNNFTGATAINAGTLILPNGAAIGSTAVSIAAGGALVLQGSNVQLPSTTVVASNGAWNLSGGAVSTVATLTGTSGSVYIDSTSSLTLGSGSYSGSLNLAGGSLTKSGTGTLLLSGVNNFAGTTSITAGVLQLSQTGSTYTGAITVSSAATLDLLVGGTGQLLGSEVNTIVGKTTLSSGAVLAIDTTGGNFAIAGSLPTGGYGLTKNGTNTLTLNGSDSFSGSTLLTGGTLTLTNAAALAGTSGLTFSTGTTLDIATSGSDVAYPLAFGTTSTVTIASDLNVSGSGINHTLGTLSAGGGTVNIVAGSNVSGGSPSITLPSVILSAGTAVTTTFNPTTATLSLGSVAGTSNTLTHTLALGGTVAGNSVTGPILNGSTGATNVLKNGTSVWTLSGTSAYTGTTVVAAGELLLTGQINNTSIVTIGNTSGTGAALYQSGANSNITYLSTTASQIGGAVGTAGYYNLSGGTLNIGGELDAGGSSGGAATFGQFDMTGGTAQLPIPSNSGPYLIINRGAAAETGVINITGGTFQENLSSLTVDNAGNGLSADWTTGQTSVVTLGSIGATTPSGTLLTPSLTVKLNHGSAGFGSLPASANTSTLNLDGGGVLQTLGFLNPGPATNYSSTVLNFNGGTLQAGNASNGTFLQNLGGVYVYGAGGTIDDNGKSITIAQSLLGTTFNGVSGVAVSAGGSGYAVPPKIAFSGGGGTGATGYATISPATGAVTGVVITNPGTGYTSVPTVTLTGVGGTGATLGTVSTIVNAAGGLTFQGAGGAISLTGSDTYTGLTTVASGTLILDHSSTNNGSLGSAVTVLGSGSSVFYVKGSTSIGGGLTTIGSGATINLSDGVINTLTVNGGISLASGSILNVDVGSTVGSIDTISATGPGTLNGVSTVNLSGATIVGGNYLLLTASGGGFTPGNSNLVVGSHPAGRFNSFSFNQSTSTQEVLSVSATAFASTDYWTGSASRTAGDTANNWSTGTTTSNFSVNLAGTTDQNQVPGAVTDVIFTAANATPSSGSALSTQLDANYSIKGLSFAAPTLSIQITSTAVNPNGYTFTLGSDGLNVSSGSKSSGTIGTGSLILGTSQSWADNSATQSLTVNANISSGTVGTTLTLNGTGAGGVTINGVIGNGAGPLAVVFAQTGNTVLNASNTYGGGTALTSGTVVLGNAGALGSGTVTINGGQLNLNGISPTIAALTGSGGVITDSGAASTLTIKQGAYNGAITDGAGQVSLLKTTSSTLSLGGTNSYSGTTNISAGTLQLASSNGASAASPFTISTGAYLDLNGNTGSVASLSGGGTITNTNSSSSILTVKTPAAATFTGTISDGASQTWLTYNGAGTQTLTGSSNFSGGTTVSSGKLAAFNTQALGTGTVKLNGGILSLGGTATGNLFSSGYTTNGSASQTGSTFTLTNSQNSQAGSAFSNTQATISDSTPFAAQFIYQASNSQTANISWADGIMFVLQNDSRGASAVGGNGNTLGFGSDGNESAITPSAGIAINLYSVHGGQTFLATGGSATPVGTAYNTYTGNGSNGFSPQPQTNFSATVGDPIQVTLSYSNDTLTETELDLANNYSFTASYPVDLVQTLGGTAGGSTTATIGFTGSTGGYTSTQNVSNFTFVTGSTSPLASLTYTNSAVALAGTHSGIELNSSTGQPVIQIGTLTLQPLSLVKVTSVTGGAFTHGALTVAGLSISGTTNAWTGKLDLANNSLVVQGGNIATLTNQVGQGYQGGRWNGSGITSSTAAADTTHITALGVILNDDGSGNELYGASGTIAGTFSGAVPALDDVLIKYTYYGDTDLSGVVDGTDYSRIDAAFQNNIQGNSPLTGWGNGDFNYDGVIDGSDYTLMDNAFNAQSVSLSSAIASPTALLGGGTGTSAVPEPATLGLLSVAGLRLLGRRRRDRR